MTRSRRWWRGSRRGLYRSARKYDEALAKLNAGLAVNPKNVVTLANNLAWIHPEHGGEPAKDKALALAQLAKQVAGMAAVRTGDKDVARKALAVAAGSPAVFKGKDEARRTLAELR